MKIQILQENLNKGLATASRSISTKAQLPILSNILLKTEDNRLKLSATNLEIGINLWLGAKIEEEGEITVPAKVLSEIIASFPSDKIQLETKENILLISNGNAKASLNGISATEFPKQPTYDAGNLFSLPAENILTAIEQVAFAAATDDTRPVLAGVLLKIKDNSLSMAATDGYRLSIKSMELKSPIKEETSILLPAKTLLEVGRIIAENKGEEKSELQIGFTQEKNQIVFIFGQTELFSRVIEGDFPNYEKIIPSSFTTKVILDKESLNRAVKMVSIFARDSANIVKLKVDKKGLEMSANSPQVGENKNFLEAKVEGEGGEIAFNFRFLQGLLNAVTKDEVSMEINSSLNPGAFKAVGDDSFLHIIMPVRLQTEEEIKK